MFNLLHPKNTIEVSLEGIVVWFVSVFDVVVTIFDVVTEVVSIPLAIVVAIFVDTTSDKAWVTFTVVVGALFYFSCSIQAKLSSFVFSTQVWVSEFVTG